MSDTTEKSISFGFWSQLENILRPPLRANNNNNNNNNTAHSSTLSTNTTSTSVPFTDPEYVVVTGNIDSSGIENSSLAVTATTHIDQISHQSSSEEIFKRLNVNLKTVYFE